MDYYNELILSPLKSPYLPAIYKKSFPIFTGTYIAQIESQNGEYAQLDKKGSYQLRFKFDDLKKPVTEASISCRLAQSLAGRQEGIHFPLRHGTEVAIRFREGNINHPILIGILPNSAGPIPSNSNTPSMHILNSFGDNTLQFNDLKNHESIDLMTHHQNNRLTLNASLNNHKISLESKLGEILFYSGKNSYLYSGNTITRQIKGNAYVNIHNNHCIRVKNNHLSFNAEQIQFKAINEMRIKSDRSFFNIKNRLEWQSGLNFSCQVLKADFSLLSNQNILIHAAQTIALRSVNGHLIIQQANGKIQVNQAGELHIKASTINISAPAIHLYMPSSGSNL
ncbi:MAG: hypothetical protein JWM09_288 [Francisellaceae bacterium]|nr:hypothetical protein [Francisellaceae bacterium]